MPTEQRCLPQARLVPVYGDGLSAAIRLPSAKGVRDGDTFTEVPDEEIVKGYEYAKGQHVLIDPREIDELKLESKHTIDMKQFVDEDDIDSRYWEKPYYLVQMVTRLTRAIPSWQEPWPKQARS